MKMARNSWLRLAVVVFGAFGLLAGPTIETQGQVSQGPKKRLVVLRAGRYAVEQKVRVAPHIAASIAANAAPTTKFEVTYDGFSNPAKKAFQSAVNIWSHLLKSGDQRHS